MASKEEEQGAAKKQKLETKPAPLMDHRNQTHAFGKLILFGEHFVVYKAPALVGAVAAYTDCKVEFTEGKAGVEVVDERPAVPNYKVQKKEEGEEAVALVLAHMGVDTSTRGVKLTFGGDLTCVSGIGASAAQVVALARAIGLVEGRGLSSEEVNAAGYEGEKGYHGTPSGIDNTASTYGGVLRFCRTDGAPLFESKALREPVRIVYASTGITASTSTVVGDVRAKKEADEPWFAALLERCVQHRTAPVPRIFAQSSARTRRAGTSRRLAACAGCFPL